MKDRNYNFYSTIITLLIAVIAACAMAFFFSSCTKSTKTFIDDNEPIGAYHVRDPLTAANVFDQNIDTEVCLHDFGAFPSYSYKCKKCGVRADYSTPCDHVYVAIAVRVNPEWDDAFAINHYLSPKECICLKCKNIETCY